MFKVSHFLFFFPNMHLTAILTSKGSVFRLRDIARRMSFSGFL